MKIIITCTQAMLMLFHEKQHLKKKKELFFILIKCYLPSSEKKNSCPILKLYHNSLANLYYYYNNS